MTQPSHRGPYRVVASHVIDLADGRPALPHTVVDDLDPDQPHNQALIEDGQLVAEDLPVDEKLTGKALDDRCRELEIDGFSQMSADEKRAAVAAAEAATAQPDPDQPDDDSQDGDD